MTESLLSGRWRRMGPQDPDDEIQHIPTWVITADSGSTEWSLPRHWLSTWNGLTHSNLLGWVWLSLPRCTDSETEAQRWLNNLLRVTQPSRARAGTGYRGLSPSPDLLKVGGRFQWVALGATIVNKLRSQGPWEYSVPQAVLLFFLQTSTPGSRTSQVAECWRICLPMQETRVQSPGGEDPLAKGMATHSSILAWRIPWTEEPGGLNNNNNNYIRDERLKQRPRRNSINWRRKCTASSQRLY